MDLISVIVPVYNVEEYLDRCVISLINQTYTCVEIILVDDGSNDTSGQQCDLWKDRDRRIKVVHKENGGLSSARNEGLAIATGSFIAFVDSDDWVHTRYLEILHDNASQYHADISVCGFERISEYEGDKDLVDYSVKVFSDRSALLNLINKNEIYPVVWNKLYRAGLVKNELFEVGRFHEDEFFTYKVLSKSERVAYTKASLYYYFQRENSIMRTVSIRHLDLFDAFIERLSFFKENYPDLYRIDKLKFCKACIYNYIYRNDFSGDQKELYCRTIKDKRRSISFDLKELRQYSPKNIFIIIGSRYCIGLMSYLLGKRIGQD